MPDYLENKLSKYWFLFRRKHWPGKLKYISGKSNIFWDGNTHKIAYFTSTQNTLSGLKRIQENLDWKKTVLMFVFELSFVLLSLIFLKCFRLESIYHVKKKRRYWIFTNHLSLYLGCLTAISEKRIINIRSEYKWEKNKSFLPRWKDRFVFQLMEVASRSESKMVSLL